MSSQKIDMVELERMLEQKIMQKTIAVHFGVTCPAISQAVRKLKKQKSGAAATVEHSRHIVTREINAIDQLQKINGDANEILNLVMAWTRGDKTALQVLESNVKQVRYGKNATKLDLTEVKFKDPRELALKAMAEIRNQLKLQLEIFQALYDLRAGQEFQAEVLSVIGEIDKDVRDRIVHNLLKKRIVRAVIQPN